MNIMLTPKKIIWLAFCFITIVALIGGFLGTWNSHMSPLRILILSLSTIGVCALGTLIGWLGSRVVFPDYWKNKQVKSATEALELEANETGKQIKIIYQLSNNDVYAYYLYNYEGSPKIKNVRKSIRIIFILVSISGLAVAGSIIAFNPEQYLLALVMFFMAVISAFSAIFYPILSRKIIKSGIERDYGQKSNILTGDHSLTITKDTMTDITEMGESTIRWDTVKWIESTGQYLFVTVRGSGPYIIPRRAFADEQEFKQFVDTAKAYHQAAES